MTKPVEAIERIKQWNLPFTWKEATADLKSVVAYLDSIPDDAIPVVWPKELTRERLEELAGFYGHGSSVADALRALAAIAPERKKRMVNLWRAPNGNQVWHDHLEEFPEPWRKVAGPVEIDE